MALERTPQALENLERALCEHKGDLLSACRSVGVTLIEVNQWAMSDPSIAAAIKAAQLVGWASLESVAYQRAVQGVERDVYYQGEVVGQETVYSDGLLQAMLKARVPGYGQEEQHRSLTVNVAIMPRASTYEEWLQNKDLALNAPTEQPEYTDFEPVPAPTGLRDVL